MSKVNLSDMDQYKGPKWHGKDTFHCPKCPFDTLDSGTLRKHIIGGHSGPVGSTPKEKFNGLFNKEKK